MRTNAQHAASRANGARSRGPTTGHGKHRASINERSLRLLAKITVVKNESRQGFQELVRQHMLCIAPLDAVEQDAVEEIRSTTHASPDDLECLLHACRALAGRNFHALLQLHRGDHFFAGDINHHGKAIIAAYGDQPLAIARQ